MRFGLAEETRGSGSPSSLRKLIDPDGPHLERLILLSDGVFAIAMTLLALEIRVPEHWGGDPNSFIVAVAPILIAYAAAFGVLAMTWQTHRHTLALFDRIDATATALNLLLLALVALIPPVMRFTLETAVRLGPSGLAAVFRIYGWTIVALGLTQMLLWAWSALVAGLMKPVVPTSYRRWYFLRWMFANLSVIPMLVGWSFNPRSLVFTMDPVWAGALVVFLVIYLFANAREKAALRPKPQAAEPAA